MKTMMKPILSAVLLLPLASFLGAQTINIDFGDTGALTEDPGWNNIHTDGDYFDLATMVYSIADLVDISGNSTGVGASISGISSHVNNGGPNPSTIAWAPTSATSDNLFGNTGDFNSNGIYASATLSLTGLDDAMTYNLEFFASRLGVTDNRETGYTLVTGSAATTAAYLDVHNNTTETTSLIDVSPSSGMIEVEVAPGPNNNNGLGFYYLGLLQITAVPEPSSASFLFGVFGLGFLALRRRRSA